MPPEAYSSIFLLFSACVPEAFALSNSPFFFFVSFILVVFNTIAFVEEWTLCLICIFTEPNEQKRRRPACVHCPITRFSGREREEREGEVSDFRLLFPLPPLLRPPPPPPPRISFFPFPLPPACCLSIYDSFLLACCNPVLIVVDFIDVLCTRHMIHVSKIFSFILPPKKNFFLRERRIPICVILRCA